MSNVRSLSIMCDHCMKQFHCSQVLIANKAGFTKGSLVKQIRTEASEAGWVRKRTMKRKRPIDLCPQCKDQIVFVAWFEIR